MISYLRIKTNSHDKITTKAEGKKSTFLAIQEVLVRCGNYLSLVLLTSFVSLSVLRQAWRTREPRCLLLFRASKKVWKSVSTRTPRQSYVDSSHEVVEGAPAWRKSWFQIYFTKFIKTNSYIRIVKSLERIEITGNETSFIINYFVNFSKNS